jgi:3'(2'), 5'-bisphosphate nucleotidase
VAHEDWANELEAAKVGAARASAIIMDQYARLDAKSSAPADITTQTDRDSQEVILQLLTTRFPNDAFRAEEATPTLAKLRHTGPRLWIIDPIDGTRGFVTKNGEFSVMIALCVDGVPVVGVVAEPAKGVITWATQRCGCWQSDSDEPRRVAVTTTIELSDAAMIQSHAKPGKGQSREVQLLNPMRVLETYSAGVKLARIANGTADLYVCDYMEMNDWDLAAGHILVTEAGGQVSNLVGEPRVYGRESPKQLGGLLATNGRLHQVALARLRT